MMTIYYKGNIFIMLIINYIPEYRGELIELQRQQWGDGSDTDDLLENTQHLQIKLLVEDQKLYGAIVWHIEYGSVCYLDFIILRPEVQHQGWGNKLLKICLDWAKRNLLEKVECAAIEAKGIVNAKNLLEANGFVCTESIENYWGDRHPDFNCLECGQCPCVCTMHRYEKSIRRK